MKISIVGGGPAGLYFACSVKQLKPECQVKVYESQFASINAFGLGYTLQNLGSQLLARLDPEFLSGLFSDEPPLFINDALFKTRSRSQSLAFDRGYSVSRPQLMRYLVSKAQELGIKIVDKKVNASLLKKLQRSSDLVVGADGINSVMRSQYTPEFLAQTYSAKLRYSWFINESAQLREEACFYAFEAPEGVVMLTSYPLTLNKQIVIIEMTKQCANSGRFKGRSPEQVSGYLSELLSKNGDDIQLRAAGLPWYSFKMNTVKRLSCQNMVLLGDAAFSFHYSAGQGLTTAFTMGYTLANCLAKTKDVEAALRHYSQSVLLSLRQPAQQSLAHIKWFENIEQHFDTDDEAQKLQCFIGKELMRTAPV